MNRGIPNLHKRQQMAEQLMPPLIQDPSEEHVKKLGEIAYIKYPKSNNSQEYNFDKVMQNLQDEVMDKNNRPDIQNIYRLIRKTINFMIQYKQSHGNIDINNINDKIVLIHEQIHLSFPHDLKKYTLDMLNMTTSIVKNAMEYINENVKIQAVQTERVEQIVKKEITLKQPITTSATGSIPSAARKQTLNKDDQEYYAQFNKQETQETTPDSSSPNYAKLTTASRGWRNQKQISQNDNQKFDTTMYNKASHNVGAIQHNQVHVDKQINPVSSRQGGRFVYNPKMVNNYVNNNHQQNQQGGNGSLATQMFANNTRFANLTKKPTGLLPTINQRGYRK
ncbi:hypothetical protein [Candidatus Deianiraea vastatrix]|nr:hypothetical protein [Candidatus Deianiraea vastatrix]